MTNYCVKCSKALSAANVPVTCSKCRSVFHPTCVNISSQDSEYLRESDSKWTCPSCTSSGRLLRSGSAATGGRSTSPSQSQDTSMNGAITLKHFNELMEQMRAVTAGMERVERRVDDLVAKLDVCSATLNEHSNILTAHGSSIDACKSEISSLQSAHTSLSHNVSSITDKMLSVESKLSTVHQDASSNELPEILERVKKSFNIIITNLPESTDGDDMPVVGRIVDFVSANSSQHLTNAARIPSKDRTRPRWTKLSFSHPDVVSSILRNKSSLHGNPEFRHIKIQDDKTKGQIAALHSAREELRGRQASGENDITIKYIRGVPSVVATSPKKKVEASKNE